MWGVQLKRAVVYGAGVALIAGGAHLPPHERPFCWLATGPARPSDAAAGLLARLSLQPSSPPATQLLILKVRTLTSLSLFCPLSHILCTPLTGLVLCLRRSHLFQIVHLCHSAVAAWSMQLLWAHCSAPAAHRSAAYAIRGEYVGDPCGSLRVSQTAAISWTSFGRVRRYLLQDVSEAVTVVACRSPWHSRRRC